MEDIYQTEKYFLDQIINKALTIVESLYSGDKILFMFINATSYFIYIKNV